MTLDEKRQVIEVLMCAVNSIDGGTVQHYSPLGCAAIGLGLNWENPCEHGPTCAVAMTLVAKANNGLAWGCAKDTTATGLEAAYRLIETSPVLRREWFGVK